LLALAVSCVLLAAGFFSGQHQAAVSHVRCVHGELVHGPAVTTSTAVHAQADLPVKAPPLSDRHEHCVLASALHATESQCHVTNVTGAVGTYDVAIVTPLAVASHDRLYRTAPKTSPPA
jgi:hypothetical protein